MKTQATGKALSSVTSVVKIGASRQVIIPKRIHDRLELRPGDYLEVELKDDKLVLTPRALVEKRLARALEDVERGRMQNRFRIVFRKKRQPKDVKQASIHGPFSSVKEMLHSLHAGERSRTS